MPPLAVKQIGAAQHDVARLGIGKYLAPAEIGVGVLQAAGENDKRGGQQGFRHLAVMIPEVHDQDSSSNVLMAQRPLFQCSLIRRRLMARAN